MSEISVAMDGAGRTVHVGDWVGAVRLKPKPHTVVGKVVSLGTERARVKVTWCGEMPNKVGYHLTAYWRRTFLLASVDEDSVMAGPLPDVETSDENKSEDVDAGRAALRARHLARVLGQPEDTGWGSLLVQAMRLSTAQKRAEEAARGGTEVDNWVTMAFQEALQDAYTAMDVGIGETTLRKLADACVVAHHRLNDDGLSTVGSETVLDRQIVRLRYAAALDKNLPGYAEREERGETHVVSPAAWGLAEVVMSIRDRELRMLRQRLQLADDVRHGGLDVESDCRHGCRDAANEHSRLSQELEAETETEPELPGFVGMMASGSDGDNLSERVGKREDESVSKLLAEVLDASARLIQRLAAQRPPLGK